MKAQTAAGTPAYFLYASVSLLLMAGFIYMFLAGRAVGDVTHFYETVRLDALLPLDMVFTSGHIIVYAALTMILCRPKKPVQSWMTIAVWLGVMGIGVEFLQEIGGARSFGLGDIVANLTGITLALTYRCIRRRKGLA